MQFWHYSFFSNEAVFWQSSFESLFKSFIFFNFLDDWDLSEFFRWNLKTAFFAFKKSDQNCHDELIFHFSYDSMYVVLYSMSFLTFLQFTIFNNFHFSCDEFSSIEFIRIENSDVNICFENGSENAKCNFHEWKIDVTSVIFKFFENFNS